MSLINDALKRANQFPQPPVVVGEDNTFRHMEYAPKPSFPWTIVVVVLAVLGPVAWLAYRSTAASANAGSRAMPITANAREMSEEPTPPGRSPPAPAARPPRTAVAVNRSELAAVPQAEKPSPANESSPLPAAAPTHTIQAGDTPSSIARQHGIKLQALMEANPTVNARRLKVGQPLIIPAS